MSIRLLQGDCREVLATLDAGSIDACVTDPPYHLTSGKPGGTGIASLNLKSPAGRSRIGTGFMGKAWDGGDIAMRPETWADVARVLKPGAHLAAFGGTRTFHRVAVAIEDAGFEIRDTLMWVYGVGFPKSLNVSKALDGLICSCHEGKTQSKRDVRPVPNTDVQTPVYAGDEREQVLFSGVPEQGASIAGREKFPGAENGRGQSSVEGRGDAPQEARELRLGSVCEMPAGSADDGAAGRLRDGASASNGPVGRSTAKPNRVRSSSRPQAAEQPSLQSGAMAGQPQSQAGGAWPICGGCGKPMVPSGLGTALKPAWEPIIIARKPLSESSVATNVLRHGTGALNIDGCRIGAGDDKAAGGNSGQEKAQALHAGGIKVSAATDYTQGRWPANVAHSGDDEVLEAFARFGESKSTDRPRNNGIGSTEQWRMSRQNNVTYGHADTGTAARFFYTAKSSREERGEGNNHPTVKPLALMRWLCRLITPVGGTVLDPFLGSGSTAIAANQEGSHCIGIEQSAEYLEIARRRLATEAPLFTEVA